MYSSAACGTAFFPNSPLKNLFTASCVRNLTLPQEHAALQTLVFCPARLIEAASVYRRPFMFPDDERSRPMGWKSPATPTRKLAPGTTSGAAHRTAEGKKICAPTSLQNQISRLPIGRKSRFAINPKKKGSQAESDCHSFFAKRTRKTMELRHCEEELSSSI